MHGQPGSPSSSATRAALAGYRHRCGDDGGREPAGSQRLESDVEVVATWAGVVRVVAIRRPVEVLLGDTSANENAISGIMSRTSDGRSHRGSGSNGQGALRSLRNCVVHRAFAGWVPCWPLRPAFDHPLLAGGDCPACCGSSRDLRPVRRTCHSSRGGVELHRSGARGHGAGPVRSRRRVPPSPRPTC